MQMSAVCKNVDSLYKMLILLFYFFCVCIFPFVCMFVWLFNFGIVYEMYVLIIIALI